MAAFVWALSPFRAASMDAIASAENLKAGKKWTIFVCFGSVATNTTHTSLDVSVLPYYWLLYVIISLVSQDSIRSSVKS